MIAPDRPLGYSEIYLDFLAEKSEARQYYRASKIDGVAEALDKVHYNRDAIAAILERQNEAFGADEAALQNITRLKDPKSLCVFSGQQACLFGGPLLVVIKAIGIIKAARDYEEELGRPVIPIFWIAGDDHDFDEANHTFVLDRNSDPIRISYDTPPPLELPTAETFFSDTPKLHEAKGLLKETLGQSDFTSELYDLIEHAYTADDSFVSSFGKLMANLLSRFGLLLFNPGDAEVKKLAIPFFEQIIKRQNELQSLVSATNESILNSGYHIQVEKKENASYLFYNREGRTAVLRDGDAFKVGDCSYTNDELMQSLHEHPERFSPDVMTRPLFQSYLFPVLSQRGGPAEIAYLAQINPLFELFNLAPPLHLARPTATLVEARFEKLMNQSDIRFEELTGDIEQLVNRLMTETFPEDLEEKFKAVRNDVRERIKQFTRESLKFDPSLEKFSEQITGKIDYNLNAFEGKIFSSHKKKSSETRDRIYRLWHALYTNRGLQERSLNVTYFLARYGTDCIDFLFDRLDVDQKSHQLIYLSEMVKK